MSFLKSRNDCSVLPTVLKGRTHVLLGMLAKDSGHTAHVGVIVLLTVSFLALLCIVHFRGVMTRPCISELGETFAFRDELNYGVGRVSIVDNLLNEHSPHLI